MKKFLMILSIIALSAALTACGTDEGKKPNEEKNPTEDIGNQNESRNEPNSPLSDSQGKNVESNEISSNGEFQAMKNSKTLKLLTKNSYYIKYEMQDNGETILAEMTKKGNDIALRTEISEGVYRTVQTNNKIYNIMESKKMILVTDANETNTLNASDLLKEDETYIEGKETIDGVEYDYEDFDGTKYYFIGNDLKFIKAGEETETLKVLSCENKSKDEMFEIPTDYQDYGAYMDGAY